jgi:predicted RNase H-like nuclease
MVAKPLPYKAIAGVTPCPGGWLVLPARVAGVTVVAEEAFVLANLMDVLDYRPKFEFAGINTPTGLADEPSGPYRPCDLDARELLGWPRLVGVFPVPSRPALLAESREELLKLEPWMGRDDIRRLRWLREAAREIQPFHQRSFYSANPDLSFYVMNGEQPLKTSPFHSDGRLERIELIRDKLPSVDDVITRQPPAGAGTTHMLQAGAMLLTARRASGRAVNRLPADPTWDAAGMRIELVR